MSDHVDAIDRDWEARIRRVSKLNQHTIPSHTIPSFW